MEKKFEHFDTVDFNFDKNALRIIDQTLLPTKINMLELDDEKSIWDAIHLLKVRGAPAIGVAAAIGIAILSKKIKTEDIDEYKSEFNRIKNYLETSRPTAVNLFWALDRMKVVVDGYGGDNPLELNELLMAEAAEIREEDIKVCKSIGENGLKLLKDGMGILTHCNAGSLATVKYGTATAPMYLAHEAGMKIKVFADETRPLLQGARPVSYTHLDVYKRQGEEG